ncbi:hypothetical protein [Catellatospora methionotrophica]|uniref:hypothetical protein n=1 Tax=Catellatospora methionotrophica TaxID=121620 RepID=UPI0033EF0C99
MAWFGVRCVFEWEPGLYEERVTLWSADDLDSAIELASAEAREYVDSGVVKTFLGLTQAYTIGPDRPGHGDEIYSLLRDSELGPDAYLDRYFGTGHERHQTGPSGPISNAVDSGGVP